MKDDLDDRFRRQQGVITRSDALTAGLSLRQIRYRVASGLWIQVSPGVYRHPSHPVTTEQRILAAVLGAGPAAAASHQSAAYLWGLLEGGEIEGPPAVSVALPAHPRPYGFSVHRVTDLDWSRVRTWKGIECTDPLWTLGDLGGVVGGLLVDRAIDRGLAKRLITVAGLQAEVTRRSKPGRPGIGVLRDRLRLRGFVGAPNPSVLESRTLAFLARHGIPVEGCEIVMGPEGEYRIDFSLVPPVMLEMDGYVWHFSPEHMARDNKRRNALRLSGVELYVSNWLGLRRDGTSLARTLRQAINSIRNRTTAPPSRRSSAAGTRRATTTATPSG
jgi:hypothetical protein